MQQPDGIVRSYAGTILLGQKEMGRHTLRGALKTLGLTEQEFEAAVLATAGGGKWNRRRM